MTYPITFTEAPIDDDSITEEEKQMAAEPTKGVRDLGGGVELRWDSDGEKVYLNNVLVGYMNCNTGLHNAYHVDEYKRSCLVGEDVGDEEGVYLILAREIGRRV